MRKLILPAMAATTVLLFSCSSDNSDHPAANLLGTYDVTCNCQQGPYFDTVSYALQIIAIPGDNDNVEILNIHNAGGSDIAPISSPNSYEIDPDNQGAVISNVLSFTYDQGSSFCEGSGPKQ